MSYSESPTLQDKFKNALERNRDIFQFVGGISGIAGLIGAFAGAAAGGGAGAAAGLAIGVSVPPIIAAAATVGGVTAGHVVDKIRDGFTR